MITKESDAIKFKMTKSRVGKYQGILRSEICAVPKCEDKVDNYMPCCICLCKTDVCGKHYDGNMCQECNVSFPCERRNLCLYCNDLKIKCETCYNRLKTCEEHSVVVMCDACIRSKCKNCDSNSIKCEICEFELSECSEHAKSKFCEECLRDKICYFCEKVKKVKECIFCETKLCKECLKYKYLFFRDGKRTISHMGGNKCVCESCYDDKKDGELLESDNFLVLNYMPDVDVDIERECY
jgi:hypothetical protein